jgi:hypothetical protein
VRERRRQPDWELVLGTRTSGAGRWRDELGQLDETGEVELSSASGM